jgi:peptidoglycan/LPS O-acetylase OafA/YrhL
MAAFATPWRLILAHAGDWPHIWIGTDTHADALLLGCALALRPVRAPSSIGWLGIGAVVLAGAVWPTGDVGLLVFIPAATVASGVALAGCPAMLSWQPLAYVGRISYGLYLWHFLLLWWGWPAPLVIVASLAVAILSYEWLERPFLRLKDRYARVPTGRTRTVAAAPVASPGAAATRPSVGADASAPRLAAAHAALPDAHLTPCADMGPAL